MMSSRIKVQNFAIFYICLWAVAPPLAYGTEYRAAVVVAALIWFVIEVTRKDNIFVRPTVPALVAALYLVYTVTIEFTLGSDAIYEWHIQPAIMLFFLLVYESRRRNVETLAPVFWLTLATLPIWLVMSLIGLAEYGHAARVVVRSSEEAMELAEQGIGGYGLVYLMVTLLPILVYLILSRRSHDIPGTPKSFRFVESTLPILTGATAVLGTLFIMRAQYSIALYLATLSLLMLVVSRKRALLVGAFILVGLITLLQEDLLFALLETLSSLTTGSNLGRKFEDVLYSLRMDQAIGTVGDRMERYALSLELFLHNPFFGVFDLAEVGRHSAYLDRFARYGAFIGVMFVYLVLYVPIRMMKQMQVGFGMGFSVFALALLFPALNNVSISFGVALYIMFPVACSGLLQRRRAASPAKSVHRSSSPGEHTAAVRSIR